MAFSANAAVFNYTADSTSAVVAEVQAINSVSINKAEIDVTALGSATAKSFLMGRHETTFSLTLHYSNAAHGILTTNMLAGTGPKPFSLHLVGGVFKSATGAGNGCFVQSIDVNAQQDSSVQATVTFRCSGVVEFTQP